MPFFVSDVEPTGALGDWWLDTVNNCLRQHNGTIWRAIHVMLDEDEDQGTIRFAGQEIIRVREIRHPDPAAAEATKFYDLVEFLNNPTFATPKFISDLLNRQGFIEQTTDFASWTDGSTGGSIAATPMFLTCTVAAVGGEDGLASCVAAFLRTLGASYDRVDWDNKIVYSFSVARDAGTHADLRGRVQLKEANGEGILAALGIGIEIQNYDIYGECFNGGRSTVDLGVTMTATHSYRIKIEHFPGVRVDFYVNDQLKGSITTVANVPAGDAGATSYWVISFDNQAQATAGNMFCSPIQVWNHL